MSPWVSFATTLALLPMTAFARTAQVAPTHGLEMHVPTARIVLIAVFEVSVSLS